MSLDLKRFAAYICEWFDAKNIPDEKLAGKTLSWDEIYEKINGRKPPINDANYMSLFGVGDQIAGLIIKRERIGTFDPESKEAPQFGNYEACLTGTDDEAIKALKKNLDGIGIPSTC